MIKKIIKSLFVLITILLIHNLNSMANNAILNKTNYESIENNNVDCITLTTESDKDDISQIKSEKAVLTDTLSSNIDLYIQFENVLSLSLSTNKITFEDYSSVESIEKQEAVILTVDSTLPYNINAYLPQDILNMDGSSMLDRNSLGVKESSENDYNYFSNLNEKVILKGSNPPGEKIKHGIDLKLNGGKTYETDIYRAVLKFEIEQI